MSCKEPRPGTHEEFIVPAWKQSLGSTIHCMAGDATGIIAAAAVTAALGLPMGLDLIAEYTFGFAFGLLVFQALFMRKMLGGSYGTAVRRSFLPEWLSMNAVMAGMIPVMVLLMSRDMTAMEPSSPRFWGIMSLATLVGLVTAYPVNVWLVVKGLKHRMGTVRVLGEGGHGLAAEVALIEATSGEVPGPRAETTGALAARAPEGMPAGHGEMKMDMNPKVPGPQLAAITLLTLLALAAGVFVGALWGDLAMRAGEMHVAPGAPLPGEDGMRM